MKSWKTTLCGAIGAVGMYLQTVNDPSWMPTFGKILCALGILLAGYFARDNNVTSEQAGAKQP